MTWVDHFGDEDISDHDVELMMVHILLFWDRLQTVPR